MCLVLHACGHATDVAMLQAHRRRAAMVVSPCCVGKLVLSPTLQLARGRAAHTPAQALDTALPKHPGMQFTDYPTSAELCSWIQSYLSLCIPVCCIPVSSYAGQTSSAQSVASLGPSILYTGFRLYWSISACVFFTSTSLYGEEPVGLYTRIGSNRGNPQSTIKQSTQSIHTAKSTCGIISAHHHLSTPSSPVCVKRRSTRPAT